MQITKSKILKTVRYRISETKKVSRTSKMTKALRLNKDKE